MSKTLIIAEKPSVARDIAAALGGFRREQDWLESSTAIVTSAIGHLVELHVPEAAVQGAPLPVIPFTFGLQPIDKTKSQFTLIKKLLARKDVSGVVNACDAGREGELIFRLIYDHAGSRKAMYRMWLQSMTADAIREAHRDMRPGSEFDALAAAARSRAEADWLIGINGSRAISRQRGEASSAGRVQTPTLAMIVRRHLEISNFKATDYYEIHGTFGVAAGTYVGKWQNPKAEPGQPSERCDDRATAQAVQQLCEGKPVTSVTEESKPMSKASPRLYDLTTLQREANKRFGFSAKQTLDLAQALYERHKVLTYPRTDSNALPEDYVGKALETVQALRFGPLVPHAERIIEAGWVKPSKKIFDNSKISDHFAIIPTGTRPEGMSDDEEKLFDMVARRFLAAFHPAAEYLATTRVTVVAEQQFKSTGRVLTQPGWLAVYGQSLDDEDEEKEPALCVYRQGEAVRNERIELKALKTKPPKPFTEATLLQAMETAGKFVDDEELAAAMKERGLGTPATRASIIEGLLSDGGGKKEPYLVREKMNLVPTPKALGLIAFLQRSGIEALCSPTMTGDWESKLRQVEAGRVQRSAFMGEIETMTRSIVSKIMEHAATENPPVQLSCACPACGAGVVATSRTIDCAKACGFRLWREVAKHRLSDEEATALISTKVAGPFADFVSTKTGKPFSAALVLNDEHKAEFVFAERGSAPDPSAPKMACACPACRKRGLVNDGRTVRCGCGFQLWTTVAQKKLTDGQVTSLLTKGGVAVKGLKSAAGKAFDATLKLEPKTGKVAFVF